MSMGCRGILADWRGAGRPWQGCAVTAVPRCWLHPAVVVATSAIDACGLFATAALPAGTVVARLRGTEVDDQELRRLIATAPAYVDSIALDADRNLVLAPGQPIHYGNHSCEPTLWHGDALTLVTRRAVAAGEELTVDYATQTDHAEFRMACQCGAPRCRGTVTGEDWRDPTWQTVYRDHVVPAVARHLPVHHRGDPHDA